MEYSLKTAKLTNEMKDKKIPVRTVIRSKTQILGTGEYILSGNITLILINSTLCGILKLFLKIIMDSVEDYARQSATG